MFCSTKDPIPTFQKANIIYEITCPGCHDKYIGKTDRCLFTRLNEHASRLDQPMHQHFMNCDLFHDYLNLFALPSINETGFFDIDIKSHMLTATLNNFRIIDRDNNWSKLCFMEAFYIKRLSPRINVGLKASKELRLFT